jgi:hypothetical protein
MNKIFEYNSNFNKSIFLLILAISSNFASDVFGCQAQNITKNNIFARHLLLLFIIYFTISFTENEDIEPNPIKFLKSTILIWCAFVIFTKQNITFTTISGLCIMLAYVFDCYIKYYDKKRQNIDSEEINTNIYENQEKKEKFTKYRNLAFYGIIVSMSIGFILYFREKKNEYKNNFSYITFIFGKNVCSSLQ